MTESYRHSDIKYDMYWNIISDDDSYAEIEKKIGRTRTDVLTDNIAIEIQHTRIPIPSILRRMREHTKDGIHTLWIITPENLYDESRIRCLNWILFLQRLQQGVIFLTSSDPSVIIPARIDNDIIYTRKGCVVGKKLLDERSAISINDLTFDYNKEYGVNITTYPEWWLDSYLDLM